MMELNLRISLLGNLQHLKGIVCSQHHRSTPKRSSTKVSGAAAAIEKSLTSADAGTIKADKIKDRGNCLRRDLTPCRIVFRSFQLPGGAFKFFETLSRH